MKRSSNKFWAACVAFLMVLSLALACYGEDLEPVKFTVFIATPSQQPTPDNKIFKLIEEEFGVTFEFDILAGDLDQKMGVLIASGDYPDIMSGHTRFNDAGAFIPLEDLIEEHAPNLKKHYEKAWYLMKYKDGHVYVLPNYGVFHGEYRYNRSYGPAFWIQKAVLKEFGYPKVRTLDEYFDLIKQYKDKYPTIDGQPTIGFEILSEGWRNFCLKNPPQHLVGHPNDGGVIVENNVAQVFAHKDIAKRYYKKLNEMNQLGLIDEEAFVLSYDQYIAKLSSGRVLGMFDQGWNFLRAEDSLKTQERVLRTYAPCPVTYDASIKDYYMDRPPVNVDRGFGITVDCKDPVRVIKLFDALMDERWQKILYWGFEGEDYLVDENGRFYRTPEQRVNYDDPAYKQAHQPLEFGGYLPKMEGTFSDGNATSPGMQPEEYYATLKPEDKELLSAYGYKTYGEFFSSPPENPVYYPAWSIPLEEGSPERIVDRQLDDLAMKYLPKVILAKPEDFDGSWEEYVAAIQEVDVNAYEDAVNAGIQQRIRNAQAAGQ